MKIGSVNSGRVVNIYMPEKSPVARIFPLGALTQRGLPIRIDQMTSVRAISGVIQTTIVVRVGIAES